MHKLVYEFWTRKYINNVELVNAQLNVQHKYPMPKRDILYIPEYKIITDYYNYTDKNLSFGPKNIPFISHRFFNTIKLTFW